MGTVIKIEDNIIIVEFENGIKREYLIDNFVMIPVIGQKVSMNKKGLFIDCSNDYKDKINKTNNSSIIVTILATMFALVSIFVIIMAINTGLAMHEGMTSCIEDCESGKNKCPD